jgi:outer membrane receptor protein involved in Fe transport
MKFGVQAEEAPQRVRQIVHGDLNYTYLNGRPASLTQWATPWTQQQRIMPDLGVYAQDRWTAGRLTLSYGLRFDYLRAYVPDQPLPPTQFLAARDLRRVDCLPCWTDVGSHVIPRSLR